MEETYDPDEKYLTFDFKKSEKGFNKETKEEQFK